MRKPYGSDVASLAKAERHKHAAPEKVSETVLAIAKKEERRAHAQPMAAYRPLFTAYLPKVKMAALRIFARYALYGRTTLATGNSGISAFPIIDQVGF